MQRMQSGVDTKSTAESLKSRWYSFRSSIQSRCKESINQVAGFKSKGDNKSEAGPPEHTPH